MTPAVGSWLGAAALAFLSAFSADGVVQLLTVALIAAAAIPVLRNKTKDATIEALRSSAEARGERIKDLEADLRGCKARADDEHAQRLAAEKRCAKLEGQVEELRPYGEAFAELKTVLGRLEAAIQAWITKDASRGLD